MSSINLSSITSPSGLTLKGGAISAPLNPGFKVTGAPGASNVSVSKDSPVILPSLLYDRTNMYTLSNGKATVTQPGFYLINAILYLNTATSGSLLVNVNGTAVATIYQQNNTTDVSFKGSTVIKCNATDVVTLVPSTSISVYVGDVITSQYSMTFLS